MVRVLAIARSTSGSEPPALASAPERTSKASSNRLARAVIMLTGHGSERAARAGLAEGAFDYLTKPCQFEELLAKIGEAVGRKDLGP